MFQWSIELGFNTTGLLYFLACYVSVQAKMASFEILMRKIVAIETDLSFSGDKSAPINVRRVCILFFYLQFWVNKISSLKNITIEHSQRLVNLETFDQSDEETWTDQQKYNEKKLSQWQRQIQWQKHLENTVKERPKRLVTLETFDQSDEETWFDQQKDNDNDEDNENDNDN